MKSLSIGWLFTAACFLLPSTAAAQATTSVATEAALRAAIAGANPGDTIVFTANITLTQELPSIATNLTVNGAGFTLSGNNQHRGFVIAGLGGGDSAPITVAIENITIANAVAAGGTGGAGAAGGGGGAGLGGALLVGDQANVTISGVTVTGSSAVGGTGGAGGAGTDNGGGGGMGGNGGAGNSGAAGGGGGFGASATGGTSGGAGGAGTLTGVGATGDGGAAAGGGGGGSSPMGGGGGGAGGGAPLSGSGGAGGYGGGGGAGTSAGSGASGGFGGGGGGSNGPAGNGGYGGGGGGTLGSGSGGSGGLFAGGGAEGAAGAGGGGGAGLGGAIFVQGNGTLTVAGALNVNGNSVTAGAGASGGTNGSAAGSGMFLGGTGTLTFATGAGATATVRDAIVDETGALGPRDVGQWSLVKNGTGTLELFGTNLYAGGTQVNGGTLRINGSENVGSGSLTLSGARLSVVGSSVFTQNLFLENTATVEIGSGAVVTWSGSIFEAELNAGSLEVTGGGTLALTAASNSYTGATSVFGGSTLRISSDAQLGGGASLTLGNATSSGTLALTTGNNIASSRLITLGAGGGTFDTQGTSTLTLTGSVSGAGTLTKAGTGTLVLSGAGSYTGGTNITAGTLRAGTSGAVNANGNLQISAGALFDLNNFAQTVGSLSGAGAVTLGSATLTAGGDNTSTLYTGSMSGTGSLVKTGTGTLTLTGTNTYSGGTTVAAGVLAGTTQSLQGNITNNAVVGFDQATIGIYSGVISGTGSLFKAGTGSVTLSGANTYTGTTSILGGTLALGRVNALNTSASVDVSAGAIFNLNGFNQTLGTLTGAGAVQLLSATLDVGGTGANMLFSGALSGSGGLVKSGTGVLTLSGTNNYSGGTLISGGTLAGTTTSLQGNIVNNALLVFDQSSSGTFVGSVSGTGTLIKSGGGTVVLSGANSYTGGTIVSAGALVGSTDSLQGNITNNAVLGFDQASAGTYSGVISGTGSLFKAGGGTLTLTGANSYSGGTFVLSGDLVGTTTSLQGNIVNNGRVFFEQASAGTYAGSVSGSGSLFKTGAGTLTLTGAQSYSGGTTILAGTLAAGAVNVLSISSSLEIAAGASFSLNGFSQSLGGLTGAGSVQLGSATLNVGSNGVSTLFSGVLSGSGGLIKSGIGVLTLTGANTYTGGTLLSAGTLIGTTTSLQGNIVNNALLIFDQASSANFSGRVTGSGALVKTGAGTITLTSALEHTGGTTILAGGFAAGARNVFGSSVIVSAGTRLDFNGFDQTIDVIGGSGDINLGSARLTTGGNNEDSAFDGVISGTGSVTKNGSGTLILTGANNYSGGTVVLGGTLVGNTRSLQGNIQNDAIVVFDEAADATYSGSMSGTGILAKTGAGTLTLTGNNTYSGGTVISGGTLAIAGGTLSGTVVANGRLLFTGERDTTFSGNLSGAGNITKSGTGTLFLTGNHGMTGTLRVNQGTLSFAGFTAGSIEVLSGARLLVPAPPATTLSLTPTSLLAGDQLTAPAPNRLNTPPLLTIAGNLTMLPGSIFSIPVGSGPNPSVLVGGTASLVGTTINVTPLEATTQRTTSFLALAAVNGLTMSNVSATSSDSTFVPYLRQDTNALYVTLLNLGVPLSSAVTSGNSTAVAAAIDSFKFDAQGDRLDVVRELFALSDGELEDALRQVAGEPYASVIQVSARAAELATDSIRSEIAARNRERRTSATADAVQWWTQFGGERMSLDNADGSSAGTITLGNGLGGVDWRPSSRLMFGLGGGFTSGSLSLSDLRSNTDVQTPRAFGYVGYRPKGFGLRAGGSVARQSSDTKRQIQFQATLPSEIGGGPIGEGIDRQAQSEEISILSDQWTEYDDETDIKTYSLEWFFGLRRVTFGRQGFVETGANSLSLLAPDQTLKLRQADARVYIWRRERRFRPYAELMYRRELTKGNPAMRLEFDDVPNSAFEVEGLPTPRDMFNARAGVTYMTAWLGAWTFEYHYRRAQHQTVHGGDFRIRF